MRYQNRLVCKNEALKTAVCVGNLTPHMYIPKSNLESLV